MCVGDTNRLGRIACTAPWHEFEQDPHEDGDRTVR